MFVTKKTFNKFVDEQEELWELLAQEELWELLATVIAGNIFARAEIRKDVEELREDVDYLLDSLEDYLD